MLDDKRKKKITSFIEKNEHDALINFLNSLKTKHAGTPTTDIKRFSIKELIKNISDIEDLKKREKTFFDLGKKYCSRIEPVSKELGISIIWLGYKHNKAETKNILLKIADDDNWEVREYAAGAFINILKNNPELHKAMLSWIKHKSENVRRTVVFSALAYKEDATNLNKAFELLEPLLSDSSIYVKKNLGPFILGSHFGSWYPEDTMKQLKKWLKLKSEHAKWNIAMAFNNNFGNIYPEKALEILSELLKDLRKEESKVVRRAVVSTLRHLNKRYSKLIQEFIKKEQIAI